MRLDQRLREDWAVAASFVLHGAAIGILLMRFQPAPRIEPPPRIEVRLAPAAQNVVAAKPVETVVAAKPVAPPPPAPTPEPEVIRSKAVEAPPVARKQAKPPPRPRPEPRARPEPAPRPRPSPPVQAARPAPAPAPVSAPRPAAAPAPAAAPVAAAPSPDYLAKISAQLARFKVYPRGARLRRIEGDVMLWFAIDRGGRLLDYRIVRSSGYAVLDEAVDRMIHEAAPFPPMPDSMPQARIEITQPVTFRLR